MKKREVVVVNKRQKDKPLAVILVISALLIALFFIAFPFPRTKTEGDINIRIWIPDDFSLDFYDSHNNSQWSSRFLVYRLMINGHFDWSGEEDPFHDSDRGIYNNSFTKNFVDQVMLSYYFDLGYEIMDENMKEYVLSGIPTFNGKILEYTVPVASPTEGNINAFDLSILNESLVLDCFDFGNDAFIPLQSGMNDIKIINVDCLELENGIYTPYLNLEVNGLLIRERMAWNHTLNLNI